MTLRSVLEAWDRVDQACFHWINDALYFRPLADAAFWLANDFLLIGMLLACLAGYAWKKGWLAAMELGIWSSAVIVLASGIQNEWLKPFFNRPRPFMTLAKVHLCVRLGELDTLSLSFPSTHSAIAAALAAAASTIDSHLRWPMILFALGIGLGTIYSGGHYPGDVLAGYAVGLALGWILRPAIRAGHGFIRPKEELA